MATTAGGTKRSQSPKVTVALLVTVFGKLIGAIKANFTSTKPITFNNVATTWGAVTTVFQTAVDKVNAAATAKKAYATAVVDQHAALTVARAQLRLFTAWAISQYGDAAYAMFGLVAPKPRAAKSAVAKAVATSKGKATRAAKKQALASVTGPSEEESAGAAIIGALAPSAVPAPAPAPAKP
jgi:hypothetical protein